MKWQNAHRFLLMQDGQKLEIFFNIFLSYYNNFKDLIIMTLYTKEGRLSDVIALITLLSVDHSCFRTLEGIKGALRRDPISAQTWFEVAKIHPEFFRFNGTANSVALLIRSYFPEEEVDGKKTRNPLSVSETQKLIDTAVSLHDKELLRKQRYNYWLPLITSLVVASIAVGGNIYTTNKSSNSVGNRVDSLTAKIMLLTTKIDSLKR